MKRKLILWLLLPLFLIFSANSCTSSPDVPPSALSIDFIDVAGDSGIIMAQNSDHQMIVILWFAGKYQTATCDQESKTCTIKARETRQVDREGFEKWLDDHYKPLQNRIDRNRINSPLPEGSLDQI
jgi:hypothetical protein